MKYFLDTEFLEGPQPRKLLGFTIGETKPTIDLISIALVAEDGREFYAVSKDFNLDAAWNAYDLLPFLTSKNHSLNDQRDYFVRDKVLRPIFYQLWNDKRHLDVINQSGAGKFTLKNLRTLIGLYGKTNEQIRQEIYEFVNDPSGVQNIVYKFTQAKIGTWTPEKYPTEFEYIKQHNVHIPPFPYSEQTISTDIYCQPEFWADYACYDWVVFCWLFGKMIDLPKGFPLYCNDLQQLLEMKEKMLNESSKKDNIVYNLRDHEDFPKETNEHNALLDASQAKKLYEFLTSI